MIKIIIGVAIIVISFIYLMKNHDQSLMDALMGKQRKKMEEFMVTEASETPEKPDDSQDGSTPR